MVRFEKLDYYCYRVEGSLRKPLVVFIYEDKDPIFSNSDWRTNVVFVNFCNFSCCKGSRKERRERCRTTPAENEEITGG